MPSRRGLRYDLGFTEEHYEYADMVAQKVASIIELLADIKKGNAAVLIEIANRLSQQQMSELETQVMTLKDYKERWGSSQGNGNERS